MALASRARDDVVEVGAHAGKTFVVGVDDRLRLRPQDPELSGETERGQSVGESVVHCLRSVARRRVHRVELDVEKARSCRRVHVLTGGERLEQPLVLREVREDAQLDLGVVSDEQRGVSLPRHERAPHRTTFRPTHRDVLQVRVR